ncbi:hypothetical protein KAS14_05760, partial [Candidatus Bathyarchaeota archaeon]|nr:hypothetical protein [Candidatus Bathyarchaeota archaeon]
IVSPIHKGKRGHPVLFSKELFDEILSLRKNMMIREVIHRHSDLLLTIKADRWTTMDIDTPKDFMMAMRLLEENLS